MNARKQAMNTGKHLVSFITVISILMLLHPSMAFPSTSLFNSTNVTTAATSVNTTFSSTALFFFFFHAAVFITVSLLIMFLDQDSNFTDSSSAHTITSTFSHKNQPNGNLNGLEVDVFKSLNCVSQGTGSRTANLCTCYNLLDHNNVKLLPESLLLTGIMRFLASTDDYASLSRYDTYGVDLKTGISFTCRIDHNNNQKNLINVLLTHLPESLLLTGTIDLSKYLRFLASTEDHASLSRYSSYGTDLRTGISFNCWIDHSNNQKNLKVLLTHSNFQIENLLLTGTSDLSLLFQEIVFLGFIGSIERTRSFTNRSIKSFTPRIGTNNIPLPLHGKKMEVKKWGEMNIKAEVTRELTYKELNHDSHLGPNTGQGPFWKRALHSCEAQTNHKHYDTDHKHKIHAVAVTATGSPKRDFKVNAQIDEEPSSEMKYGSLSTHYDIDHKHKIHAVAVTVAGSPNRDFKVNAQIDEEPPSEMIYHSLSTHCDTDYKHKIHAVAVAVTVTGSLKRDFKVKSLKAAAAAKFIQEEKENQRITRKKAFDAELERNKKKKAKEMELVLIKKQELLKKKEADIAAARMRRLENQKLKSYGIKNAEKRNIKAKDIKERTDTNKVPMQSHDDKKIEFCLEISLTRLMRMNTQAREIIFKELNNDIYSGQIMDHGTTFLLSCPAVKQSLQAKTELLAESSANKQSDTVYVHPF